VIEVTGAQERACTLETLFAADEVFLASTIREVQPVVAVDDHSYELPGSETARIAGLVDQRIRLELRS
jgi:branched-chain amino acid aminotransferase